MNKNKWDYKYNFNTYEENKDIPGIKLKFVNSITFTTYLGKSMANKLAKRYVENYEYPERVVGMYYSQTNNRYMLGINYVGKTKESVG